MRIEIPELGRVEIELGGGAEAAASVPGGTRFTGYMAVGKALRPLPVGSTFDRRAGRFSWMPGPGFVGTYELVFLETGNKGIARKISIQVTVKPKLDLR